MNPSSERVLHILFLLAGVLLLPFSRADSRETGELAGRIIDVSSNRGIPRVMIKIGEMDSIYYSDDAGKFLLRGLREGNYILTLQAAGYGRTVLLGIPVLAGQVLYQEYFLQKGEQEGEKFYIGGIEVSAQRELLPEKAPTTTTISSSEIEHLQASSLGDVLELIPGQRFTNPGSGKCKADQPAANRDGR